MTTDGHLGRRHLKGREGDAANVIFTAVRHSLRLVLAWLRALCRLIVLALLRAFATRSQIGFLTDDGFTSLTQSALITAPT
jgi:hypothetical protein